MSRLCTNTHDCCGVMSKVMNGCAEDSLTEGRSEKQLLYKESPDNDSGNNGKIGDLLERALREATEDVISGPLITSYQPNVDSNKAVSVTFQPLGSKQNPIDIIRRGNTFYSTQCLSEKQLDQIAQVLRTTTGPHDGGLVTPTKVVYHVVYPSEMRGQSHIPVRIRGKRPVDGERSEEAVCVEATFPREERAERKKHRPRTRSGRISKPPFYMVKDYKRIHTLDFDDEKCGDSDGGYSDFHFSDEELEGNTTKTTSLPPGVTTSRARHNRCCFCHKAYIGKSGLARHFRLHPTHRNVAEVEKDVHNSFVDFENQLTNAVLEDVAVNVCNKAMVVRQPNITLEENEHTKCKLHEILDSYSDSEVQEVVLPRLAKSVTTIDFLKERYQLMSPTQHAIHGLYEELEALLEFISTEIADHLCRTVDCNSTRLEVRNRLLAKAVGMEVGSHFVKDHSYVKDEVLVSPAKCLVAEASKDATGS